MRNMVFVVEKPTDPVGLTLESWAQGFLVGSLLIMAGVTFANMRRNVLLHKLILIELFLGMLHGFFMFVEPPIYNWYLSATAILLNASWSLHNVVAWIKNKPFLPRWGSIFYITTVVLVQPYWILEITANFLYFSGQSRLFVHTRPYEALFRDPWWIFTVLSLFYNIKSRYEFGYIELMRVSPRFAILLVTMLISVAFIIVDVLAVTHVVEGRGLPDGINPFWKMAFVFKCFTDTIVLDDFKTALDRLKHFKLQRIGSVPSDGLRGEFSDFSDPEQARAKKAEQKVDLDISNPSEFVYENAGHYMARNWTKAKGGVDREMDLEAALREVVPEAYSSKSKSSGG